MPHVDIPTLAEGFKELVGRRAEAAADADGAQHQRRQARPARRA